MRTVKIVNKILIVILVIIFLNAYSVSATTDSIWQKSKNWLSLGERESKSNNAVMNTSSYQGIEDLSGLLFGVGIFVTAIVGTIIGIKFMMVSPEEKANLKKDLIPYIVGTVIILGALGIWKLAVGIFEDMAH